MTDSFTLLRHARKAWADKNAADFHLSRLAKYSRLTPGMKDDQRRWSGLHREATATLNRILGTPTGESP